MIELTVLLGLAAAGMGLSRWTQLPAIPFLLAGSLGLGATGLVGDPAFVEDVLFLSVSVLLFVVGTDLSPERVGPFKSAALRIGLLLSQTSELSLVVGLQALVVGQIGSDVFAVIVLTTVLTMIATPLLTRDAVVWELVRWHPSRHPDPLPEVPSGHVLLLGGGRSARPILRLLRESDYEVIVVDEDPAVVDQLREQVVTCVRGDGGDLSVLLEAGAAQARVIVLTLRNPAVLRDLLNYVGDTVPILVRVFEDHEVDWVEARGGMPIPYADAAGAAFANWFDREDLAP